MVPLRSSRAKKSWRSTRLFCGGLRITALTGLAGRDLWPLCHRPLKHLLTAGEAAPIRLPPRACQPLVPEAERGRAFGTMQPLEPIGRHYFSPLLTQVPSPNAISAGGRVVLQLRLFKAHWASAGGDCNRKPSDKKAGISDHELATLVLLCNETTAHPWQAILA